MIAKLREGGREREIKGGEGRERVCVFSENKRLREIKKMHLDALFNAGIRIVDRS